MRLRSPLGPFGDEPSASWQRRRSCPLQTRTPDESLRILPPWLSIPTDFPLRAIARTRVSILLPRVGQNQPPKWANSEYRNHLSTRSSILAVRATSAARFQAKSRSALKR